MISDNTTTFKSAAEELKSLSASEEVRAVLNREGVTCKYLYQRKFHDLNAFGSA